MDLALPTLEQQSEKDHDETATDTTANQWIDRIESQQSLLNEKRIKMYKPKYKLTLWDIREVFDCRIRRVRNHKHELLFTIEISNAPNKKIEVSKNDINGSTVTRGDIFVRFFKTHYSVDNTHQLEHLLLQRLKAKRIELHEERDSSYNFANIPPLKPQTIKSTTENNTTSCTTPQDEDDDVCIISRDASHSLTKCTSNGIKRQQSPQILSITTITPTSNPTNKKRPIHSMLFSGKSNGNPFMNRSQHNKHNSKGCHLSLPSLSSDNHNSSTSQTTNSSMLYPQQPAAKRQKINHYPLNLLLRPTMIASNDNNNNNSNNNKRKTKKKEEDNQVSHKTLYTKTKLKLEEMIKLHHIQDDKSARVSSMDSWCESMNNLEHGAFQLLAMYASIQQESEQFTSSIVAEKTQFEKLEKENRIRNELQNQLGQNLNTLSKQLNSVDAEIRKLVIKRQQTQQNLSTTKQTMEANKVSMNNYSALKQQYIAQMSERVKHIQDTQSFLPVIKKITERYQETMQKLRDDLHTFESEWKQWNEKHVQQWIKHIENGKFNAMDKYAKCMNHIASDKVNGSDLVRVNDFMLRTLFGITEDNDRKLLLRNIERLRANQDEHHRNGDNNNNNKVNVLLQAIEMLEAEEKTK